MKKTTAAITGFLVASLVPPLIMVLLSPIRTGNSVFSHIGLLPIYFFFSVITTLFLGVPAFLLLHSLKAIRWWSTVAFGGVIGGLVGVVVRHPSSAQLGDVLPPVFVGAAAALSFWLVWRKTPQQ